MAQAFNDQQTLDVADKIAKRQGVEVRRRIGRSRLGEIGRFRIVKSAGGEKFKLKVIRTSGRELAVAIFGMEGGRALSVQPLGISTFVFKLQNGQDVVIANPFVGRGVSSKYRRGAVR